MLHSKTDNKFINGVTLIELTIGLAIFMVLLLVVIAMMLNVFKSDMQSRAYEEVQLANLLVVNDMLLEARFSVEANKLNSNHLWLKVIDESNVGEFLTVEYKLESNTLKKIVDDFETPGSLGYPEERLLVSDNLIVEKFEIEDMGNKVPPLFRITFEAKDALNETEVLDERVFLLSVRG